MELNGVQHVMSTLFQLKMIATDAVIVEVRLLTFHLVMICQYVHLCMLA